jgi:hypothetical protein
MSESSEAAAESALYCEYGRTMHAAQMFEYTVRQLVSLDELTGSREERDQESVEVSAEIARFFKRPLAKLAKQLGVEEDFADELRAAVATRNTLAHDYLLIVFLELNVAIARHHELIATLIDARNRYDDVTARLDVIVDDRHKQLGIDPSSTLSTAEEMRRAMLGDEES